MQHPPPERVQVAGSESAAEATARCGNKQWSSKFPLDPKNIIYTVYIYYIIIYNGVEVKCLWKILEEPANVGENHPFQSI